jgi:tRNA nucleotidyltransferase (CCA-adding enzyme)
MNKNLIHLADTIKDAGGRALLVGGSVRDEFLGLDAKDLDVEVYGIEPDRLEALLFDFAKRKGLSCDFVGKSFGVFKLGQEFDVSIPRREKKVGEGHKGFEAMPDPFMSPQEAARRRDFTINAMSRDILTGELLDFYGGQEDLARGQIRHVDDKTFVEDSLRVLRAVQFAARFEFGFNVKTFDLCQQIDLSDLPAERIYGEFEKLLLKAEKPGKGLKWMLALGILDKLFPEIKALLGCEQEPDWHPEGDVFEHTCQVLDVAAGLRDGLPYEKQVCLMLAALCHDFGKPETTEFKDGRIRSHAHDVAGLEPTESFLDRLRVFTLNGYDVRAQVLMLVKHHLFPGMLFTQLQKGEKVNVDGAIRRMARRCDLDLLARVSRADCLGRVGPDGTLNFNPAAQEFFIERAKDLKVEEKAEPMLVMGRDLIAMGFKPSKLFSVVLEATYERQMDGERDVEALKAFAHGVMTGELHKQNVQEN